MKVIITVNVISIIGGVETWLYNLVHQLYEEYNILVLYEYGDVKQLTRLNQYVNVEKMSKTGNYTCDACIIGSSVTPFYNNIHANKYIQMIHCDFNKISKKYFIKRNLENIEYITVSQVAKNSFTNAFHLPASVIENPLDIKRKPRRILHLISCTRLSEEKGYERMKQLVKLFNKNHIPFEWKIYTNLEFFNQDKIDDPSIIYMETSLDVIDQIVDSDYGVQLSDTESYGYFIHECLQYHTPVLVTDLPCLKDITFEEGNHGYILDFDMKHVDVHRIYNEIPSCNKSVNEPNAIEKWKSLLGESDTPTVLKENVKIKVTKEYFDRYYNKLMKPNTIIEVPAFRANELCHTYKYAVML